MPDNEIKECPDPRCIEGVIICEEHRNTCMTCNGQGKGTEEFFQENRRRAEKTRRGIFADVCAL